MKNKLKKILFPFYSSERHGFLMKKWWFRLLFVFYITGIIVSPVVFGTVAWELLVEPCFKYKYGLGIPHTDIDCIQVSRDTMLERRLYIIFGPIITHYLIQLALFKIVMDFIVLGGKK